MAEAQWYVVHTYSGYENKVKADIETTVENRQLQDEILEVRVPEQAVEESTKSGNIKSGKRKLFPAYVFINMVMNDATWYVVRNTRGVTGFVGPGSKPVPLTQEEMDSMNILTETKAPVDLKIGETVVITTGVWKDSVGEIQQINENNQTVTINVDMFGRETPTEISYYDIKKIG